MKKLFVLAAFAGLCGWTNFTLAASTDALINGEYLARAGDCISCHTAKESKPFAGGHALNTPFGKLYSPNITPDKKTGIGEWSFEDFWQALHHGKGIKGEYLYPTFSFTSFTKITREDARDLYAYLQVIPAIEQKNREPQMDFPFNIRMFLAFWRAMYFEEGEFKPDNTKSEQWNRGAYLVEGLGHCNECHTTRNFLGAMDKDNMLAGGHIPLQGWYAPNLSMQAGGGLEGWSKAEVKRLLKTGLTDKGGVIGPMADVVRNSTQYLNDTDLDAIAEYLDSLPAPTTVAATVTQKATDHAVGQEIYNSHCADCHGQQGEGVSGIYPTLVGNSSVVGLDGVNAIRSVLLGGFPPATQSNPEPYSMPPFAADLSNAEVAAVVNYLRQSWGNQASAVSAQQVSAMRSKPTR